MIVKLDKNLIDKLNAKDPQEALKAINNLMENHENIIAGFETLKAEVKNALDSFSKTESSLRSEIENLKQQQNKMNDLENKIKQMLADFLTEVEKTASQTIAKTFAGTGLTMPVTNIPINGINDSNKEETFASYVKKIMAERNLTKANAIRTAINERPDLYKVWTENPKPF